jgi:hypothetical protein
MEIILRFMVLPVSLVASIVFCLAMRASVAKWPSLAPLFWRVALVGTVAVSVCVALSIWPGPAYLETSCQLSYLAFYRLCFLIGPPVVATFLIVDAVTKRKGWLATFLVPSIACFAVCAVFLFADIAVYEAAFGPS